jgi:endonuclease/exonuclease/phosphatase family metal-dependent hydrolase
VLKHNCRRAPEVVQALLVTMTDMKYDIALIQEPPVGKRAKMTSRKFNIYKPEKTENFKKRNPRLWSAVNKEKERNEFIVEERTDMSTSPDVQIFDMYYMKWREHVREGEKKCEKGRKTRIVNMYDQNIKGNEAGRRRGILELEGWEEIIDERTIIAGDFNAHDPRWGSTSTKNSEHIIKLIGDHDLYIANDGSYTREGQGNQQPTIIDLTLLAGPEIMSWAILDRNIRLDKPVFNLEPTVQL